MGGLGPPLPRRGPRGGDLLGSGGWLVESGEERIEAASEGVAREKRHHLETSQGRKFGDRR